MWTCLSGSTFFSRLISPNVSLSVLQSRSLCLSLCLSSLSLAVFHNPFILLYVTFTSQLSVPSTVSPASLFYLSVHVSVLPCFVEASISSQGDSVLTHLLASHARCKLVLSARWVASNMICSAFFSNRSLRFKRRRCHWNKSNQRSSQHTILLSKTIKLDRTWFYSA